MKTRLWAALVSLAFVTVLCVLPMWYFGGSMYGLWAFGGTVVGCLVGALFGKRG